MLKPAALAALLIAATPAWAAEPIIGVTWQATSIAGEPLPEDIEVTLLIDAALHASGSGGCNRYFADATVTAGTLALGNIGRTQRSCFYERNMLEQDYFDALKATTSWVIDKDTLTLFDRAAQPIVIFER